MTALSTLLAVQLGAALPPPLLHLLQAARARNHQLGISRAQLAQQEAEEARALAALAPTLQMSGSYTRNQFQASLTVPNSTLGQSPPNELTNLTIQPLNAWQGAVGLAVPLFSAVSLFRYAEARDALRAARSGEQASEQEVLLSTAQAYYQVVGDQGVVAAAERALASARDSLRVAGVKLAAGTANRLAVERARVDVARAQQTLASARQALAVAVRSLETLCGEPLPGPLPPPPAPEEPLCSEARCLALAEGRRPELAQARAALAQQQRSVGEAWGQLAPALGGSAQEHFTNAPGFVDAAHYWTAGVSLSWSVDPLGTRAALRGARARVAEQEQRLAQQLDAVRDGVHRTWLTLEADRVRLEEASSEAQSAGEALAITREQYLAGTATPLDISQAQRDAFNAEARLAQAQADLAADLLALQQAAGEPLLPEGGPP